MVFNLLGPSLEDLFNFYGRKFSLKTALMLADQLICRLDYIHSNDVIHRDIKPENYLMGVEKHRNQVYVTDLGLATERHAAQAEANTGRALNVKLVGTARFTSVNSHLGVGEWNVLGSCFSNANRYPSAAPLRWLRISRIHASLLSPGLSPMARSYSHKSRAKGGAYIGDKADDQYGRSVRGSSRGIYNLFQLCPFLWLWWQTSICLSAQNLPRSLRTPGFRSWSCIRLDNPQISDDYPMKDGPAERGCLAERAAQILLFERRPRRHELAPDEGGQRSAFADTIVSPSPHGASLALHSMRSPWIKFIWKRYQEWMPREGAAISGCWPREPKMEAEPKIDAVEGTRSGCSSQKWMPCVSKDWMVRPKGEDYQGTDWSRQLYPLGETHLGSKL